VWRRAAGEVRAGGYNQLLTGRQAAAATKLIADFPQYFAPGSGQWKSYWTLAGTAGMFTAPSGAGRPDGYRGLYELIVEAADKTGPGVLIGYSQGGLVARFLAYMDELLMPPTKRCIAGVITVQTPNHGSPLANGHPANVQSVDGLFSILTSVAGYPIGPVDVAMNVRDPATTAMLRAIVRGVPAAAGSHANISMPALLFEAGIADATVADATACLARASRAGWSTPHREWISAEGSRMEAAT
jgi:hypothetical protein